MSRGVSCQTRGYPHQNLYVLTLRISVSDAITQLQRAQHILRYMYMSFVCCQPLALATGHVNVTVLYQ